MRIESPERFRRQRNVNGHCGGLFEKSYVLFSGISGYTATPPTTNPEQGPCETGNDISTPAPDNISPLSRTTKQTLRDNIGTATDADIGEVSDALLHPLRWSNPRENVLNK